jgi:hypothetical protein
MATLNVPITKAKGATLEVDLDKLSDEVLREVYLQGLKVLLNRGASKVTKAAIPDAEELKAEALVIANKQLEAVYEGAIRFTGGKAKRASGAVMTEARRLAKALVKDELKRQGHKISHFEPSDITKAANALLETDQGKEIIAQAEVNLAERSKTPVGIDIGSLIKASPRMVDKAEKAKAAKASQASKTQAGRPKARARGQAQAQA